MTVSLKVLPTAQEHVGLVHPVDGALAADGSVWTHDAFTERQLQKQIIRRFEADADAAEPVEAKATVKAKPQAAA